MSVQKPDDTRSLERGESFLARWSRRKAQDRLTPEPASTVPPAVAASPTDPDRETRAQAAHEKVASAAELAVAPQASVPSGHNVAAPSRGTDEHPPVELPDIDLLDEDSDYSAFLAPGADADLRRRALRKLFSSPKFNAFDGLDTYRDDFTTFPPLADVITVDMKFEAERLARTLLVDDEPGVVAATSALPHGSIDASEPPESTGAPPTVDVINDDVNDDGVIDDDVNDDRSTDRGA